MDKTSLSMSAITERANVPKFDIAFETDRYLAVSGRLDISDIDWDAGKAAGLTDDEIYVLTYFSDIEGQTINYMRDLLSTEAGGDDDVIAFLTMWNYEEFFHGKALARLLAECGSPLRKNRTAEIRKARGASEVLESIAAAVLSKIYRAEFPAVHAAWGAVQELTTLHGYEELARWTTNPVLKTLCDRIAKQERRHFAWYFNSARERLRGSEKARRLTRFLLSRFWSPVGAGVKTDAEVAKVIRLLFPGERALEIGRALDEKIGTLPGLDGIALMIPYMKRALL